MTAVFADAGYWIALLNPRDGLHSKAETESQKLESSHVVTTEMVLAEVFNGLSDKGPEIRSAVKQAVEMMRKSAQVTIVPQTSVQFRDATERYVARSDKEWSLTDCASFMVMEVKNITDALAHDHHFEQAGFRALLR